MEPTSACLLEDLGVLRIGGIDAARFLQGQLSNDVGQLRGDRLLRAGLHNPQGRTLALMAMVAGSDDSILALLPRELLATVSSLLKRYVLRSKVSLTDASDAFRIVGLASAPTASPGTSALSCRYGVGDDPRHVLLQASGAGEPQPAAMARERWRALDVAAGLPQIGAVNSGQFVAQMLNLDCIDAVSFTKGCYTGQEIIARAHYRGRVKRRMQRFVTEAPAASLAIGATGRLQDGRHYHVVEAVALPDGRCEFLAVAHLVGGAQDGESAQSTPAGEILLAARPLPMSYALPQ